MPVPLTSTHNVVGNMSLSSFTYEACGDCTVIVHEKERDTLDIAREIADTKSLQGDNGAFFIMNMTHVCDRMSIWLASLPRVHPVYSIRCNPDPMLLRLLATQPGMGFLCASNSEYVEARKHINSDRILYANPLWTKNNVRRAKQVGCEYLVCDSEDDFLRVKSFHGDARVVLRVSMDHGNNGFYSGCDLNEAPDLIKKASAMNLALIGIGLSFNSAPQSLSSITSAIVHCRRLYDIARYFGLHFNIMDIGSIFDGIESPESSIFAQICAVIKTSLSVYFPLDSFCDLRVIAELGSFFVSGTFMLVTNVIGRSPAYTYMNPYGADFECDDIGFVYRTNDGSWKSFCFMLTEHRELLCEPLHDCGLSTKHIATVVGTTAKNDVLLPFTHLPCLKVGDWLTWKNVGGASLSSESGITCGDAANLSPTAYYCLNKHRWNCLQSSLARMEDEEDELQCAGCSA